MVTLILSCFNRDEVEIKEDLEMLRFEADTYEVEHKINDILQGEEKEFLDFLIKTYEQSNRFPSAEYFYKAFPDTESVFKQELSSSEYTQLALGDIRIHILKLIEARLNFSISRRISALNEQILEYGITDEISEELARLEKISNRNKSREIEYTIDGRKNYEELLSRPSGLVTGIKELDDKVGGMGEGTMNVIAGFTSQFKTTFAINIAHLNSYEHGYNIVYITLETPKRDMWWNLLSCHSYMSKFNKYPFIGHDKIRQGKLEQDEADYVFDVVETDLKSEYTDDTKTQKRGKIILLDESDFPSMSFSAVQSTLEQIDSDVGGIDAVIVDYIQLCKYSPNSVTYDETAQVNAYVSFFRRMSQSFRKYRDKDGKQVNKMVTVILLSQIRREAWQRASRHNGIYDITCMSDSSELEKSAHRIFTTYTTEDLKSRNIAQVQILKSRTGETMQDTPVEVFANGEAYIFMDEDGTSDNIFAGNDQQANLEALFGGGISSALGSIL